MKIAVLSLLVLGAAAVEDAAVDTEALIEEMSEDSVEEVEDEEASRRRRRRFAGHRHKPHGHWPHRHKPHGHWPHSHNFNCLQAKKVRNKVQWRKDTVKMHKERKQKWDAKYEQLDAEMAGLKAEMSAIMGNPSDYDADALSEPPAGSTDQNAAGDSLDSDPYDGSGDVPRTFTDAEKAEIDRLEKAMAAKELELEHAEEAINYHSGIMDHENGEIRRHKDTLKNNDCTDTVRWVDNAAAAVAKWISDMWALLAAWYCIIIDIAVRALGMVLDVWLAANPNTGPVILKMKKMRWCQPGFKKPKKDDTVTGPPPTPKVTADGLLSCILPTPYCPGPCPPLVIVTYIWKLWMFIVLCIKHDGLTEVSQEMNKVMYFILLVWQILCGSLFTALLGLGKDILYCNVKSLGCPCKNTVLEFK